MYNAYLYSGRLFDDVHDVLFVKHTNMIFLSITAIVCPEISQMGNAQVVLTNRTYLSQAYVICNHGLRLEDGSTQTTVLCRSDATWSKSNITCQGRLLLQI